MPQLRVSDGGDAPPLYWASNHACRNATAGWFFDTDPTSRPISRSSQSAMPATPALSVISTPGGRPSSRAVSKML